MLLGFSGKRKRNWMEPLKGIYRTGSTYFGVVGIQGLNIKEWRTTDSLSSYDHLPSGLPFCLQPEERYSYYIPCEWWPLELCEATEISPTQRKISGRVGHCLCPSHAFFNLAFKHISNNHLRRIISVKTLFKMSENSTQTDMVKKRNLSFHAPKYSRDILASKVNR